MKGKKLVGISREFIESLLKRNGVNFRIKEGKLPEDAKILQVSYNPDRDCFLCIVESKEFPVVEEGHFLLEYMIVLEDLE